MARVDPEKIRNVALLGHSHDGKTSLAEAMLYAGGAVDRLGRPDAGNTTFDFEPEEIKRKISIGTAIAHLTWHDHKVNLLDTPGFQDFTGDVCGAQLGALGGSGQPRRLPGWLRGIRLRRRGRAGSYAVLPE